MHIFPPAGRGIGEGSFPYDMPHSTMTNGTVGSVGGVNGQSLTIDYKGSTKTVLLTPETKVVTSGPGNLSEVTQGARVIVVANKDAVGKWTAVRIVVGKDGSVPQG